MDNHTEEVIKFIENHLYTAILGMAGTGKSSIMCKLKSKNERSFLPTAMTGAASIVQSNMLESSSSSTIHSILRFVQDKDLVNAIKTKRIFRTFESIAEKVNNIWIDEISMLGSRKLDLIVFALETYNANPKNSPLGLILTGDFGQLPPVGQDGPCFKSKFWPLFNQYYLDKVWRQTDQEFINTLKKIRMGRAEEAIDWIEHNIGFHEHIDKDFKGFTILPTNKSVLEYNTYKLKEIEGKEYTYKVKYYKDAPKKRSNIPDTLNLKENALVKVLVNNLKEGYANGSLGIVKSLSSNNATIQLLRNNKIVKINRCKCENIIDDKVKGYYSYLPLNLAYGNTVHSFQGLTVTDGLQAKLGGNFLANLHGGLYVILSRCVDYKKIRLVGDRKSFLRSSYIDNDYLNWIK